MATKMRSFNKKSTLSIKKQKARRRRALHTKNIVWICDQKLLHNEGRDTTVTNKDNVTVNKGNVTANKGNVTANKGNVTRSIVVCFRYVTK